MRSFNDAAPVAAAIQPHLEPGETLRHWAFGVKQPSVLVLLPLAVLGIMPAVIAAAVWTREYLVGLTDRRFLVLRMGSSGMEPEEVLTYSLQALPPATASTGPIFTHLRVADPAAPFVAKFNRAGMPGNRAHAVAIGEALTGQAVA